MKTTDSIFSCCLKRKSQGLKIKAWHDQGNLGLLPWHVLAACEFLRNVERNVEYPRPLPRLVRHTHTLELSANEQTENFPLFASSGAWVSHTHVDKHTNPPSLIAFSLSWVRSKDHQRPIAREIDHVGTRVKNLIKWITIFVAWVCHLSQYMETVASPFLINVRIWRHHYINMRLSFRIKPQYTSLA